MFALGHTKKALTKKTLIKVPLDGHCMKASLRILTVRFTESQLLGVKFSSFYNSPNKAVKLKIPRTKFEQLCILLENKTFWKAIQKSQQVKVRALSSVYIYFQSENLNQNPKFVITAGHQVFNSLRHSKVHLWTKILS